MHLLALGTPSAGSHRDKPSPITDILVSLILRRQADYEDRLSDWLLRHPSRVPNPRLRACRSTDFLLGTEYRLSNVRGRSRAHFASWSLGLGPLRRRGATDAEGHLDLEMLTTAPTPLQCTTLHVSWRRRDLDPGPQPPAPNPHIHSPVRLVPPACTGCSGSYSTVRRPTTPSPTVDLTC
ncbi:hypothetical protein TgHK011_007273 [Trichoderma gracile]|nr:hypothetical protein TgHK011_007273 [Trichoderma gracile]